MTIRQLITVYIVAIALVICGATTAEAGDKVGRILLGKNASPVELYAARELQRYLHQLSGDLLEIETGVARPGPRSFVIGRRQSNPLIEKMATDGRIKISPADPGPQGYVLKKLAVSKGNAIVIAGGDQIGCLYGVYGLLEDYYGVGFYLGGDALGDKKSPLKLVDVDERKAPAVYIRGFLPWTNFPQSATVYSWEDWKFIIDQMAKMRMNFLHIHNYNGQNNHNEMFHNFTYKGFMSRVWMPTVRTGHRWACPAWDIAQYRFGAGDLFDDYDFGADCALHNESLSNEQVFRKGASLFQKVIAYAHTRGVKIGLGLDINLIPKDYKTKADDPAVIAARVNQIASDYPDLDFLLCFQSEQQRNPKAYAVWRKIFDGFYEGIKKRSPKTRIAVSGWGLAASHTKTLPADVMCAPIARYSAKCESGSIYGQREFWGCPWLERDGNSSQYYYPYNIHLSDTIKAWKNRAPNMKGFYCLTWRLTDAIDPKMSFISKAPWDTNGRYATSTAVYRDYAERNYGKKAAERITKIIDQNEPFADGFGECQGTPRLDRPGGFLFNVQWLRIGQTEKPIAAAKFAARHGGFRTSGGKLLNNITHGAWVQYKDVDFARKAVTIELSVASGARGGIIEIRLGSHDGDLLASCEVSGTGGWRSWVSKKVKIKPTSGKQQLFLVFRTYPLARDVEHNKALEQIQVVDRCIKEADNMQRERLKWLRCRLEATRAHIALKHRFNSYKWDDLPGEFEPWAKNFTYRVTDISSLGNIMSVQNRFVKLHYVGKMEKLRRAMEVKPPSNVSARGTGAGAVITWKNKEPKAKGFNVYRDKKKLNPAPLPPSAGSFTDKADGAFRYTVKAVTQDGGQSLPSVPVVCLAGSADKSPPHIVVVSPPTSAAEGQPVCVKARILENRTYESVSAVLYYRGLGGAEWKKIPMARRVKGVFAAQVPGGAVTARGLEYYILASDGSNTALFPASAPVMPLSLVVYPPKTSAAPGAPRDLKAAKDRALTWSPPSSGNVFWYRIYRSEEPDFRPHPATFLTYVHGKTTTFSDNGFDLAGRKGSTIRHYRVTAVDKEGNESAPSAPATVQPMQIQKVD